MYCAIYARVSTKDQSCDMQLAALREYAQRRGLQVFREYVDTGISGLKSSRPELDKLMQDAGKRLFQSVLVWKFDRFARSSKHLIMSLEHFEHLGISFLSYSESFDTSSPIGKAMFTMIGAMAQLERDLIAERVRCGVRRHIEIHGHWTGGRKRLNVNVPTGLSTRKAAELLGVSRETIRRRNLDARSIANSLHARQ